MRYRVRQHAPKGYVPVRWNAALAVSCPEAVCGADPGAVCGDLLPDGSWAVLGGGMHDARYELANGGGDNDERAGGGGE